MALRARTVVFAALVAALASPLGAAAQPRASEASRESSQPAQQPLRPQAPQGAAANVARGDDGSERGSAVAADPGSVVRWEDENGTVHYTRAYEVPERFRPKTQRVYTTVGTMPMDRPETKKSAGSLEGIAPPATLPVFPLPPGPASPSAPRGSPGSSSGASQASTSGPPQRTPATATR